MLTAADFPDSTHCRECHYLLPACACTNPAYQKSSDTGHTAADWLAAIVLPQLRCIAAQGIPPVCWNGEPYDSENWRYDFFCGEFPYGPSADNMDDPYALLLAEHRPLLEAVSARTGVDCIAECSPMEDE